MKKSLFITVLSMLCGLVACNKEQQPEVTPDVPETPPHPIVGEWRLMNIINNKDTLILENCARKSSLLFKRDGTLTRTLYQKTEDDCKPIPEALTYTVTTNKVVLQKEANAENYDYTIVSNTLTMVYKNQSGGVQTTTYEKDYKYDLQKELIGTWYIHHLRRDGRYNYDWVLTNSNCRSQQKIVFDGNNIEIHQYKIKAGCKLVLFEGTYRVLPNLRVIEARSKRFNKVGLTEFEYTKDQLIIYRWVGNELEEEIYKRAPRWK